MASHLGLGHTEVNDPYVEALIQSFAFLTARVQLKLDAHFPQFTQQLLQLLYPGYQAPKPSMLVAQFTPDPNESGLQDGHVIARDASLKSRVLPQQGTTCEYRTTSAVTLWPIALTQASYVASEALIAQEGWPVAPSINCAIKLELKTLASLAFNAVQADQLSVYLHDDSQPPFDLYEHILVHNQGFMLRAKGDRQGQVQRLSRQCIVSSGFDDTQAVLPKTHRLFQGHRLLQEYFLCAQRFLFIDLCGLRAFFAQCHSTEIELLIVLDRRRSEFDGRLKADNFRLHCAPAVNLFPKPMDRLSVSDLQHEYEVVADRTRPLQYEVYAVTEVKGYSANNEEQCVVAPAYGRYDHPIDGRTGAFYTTRQTPRLLSAARKQGRLPSYIGSSTYISFSASSETFPSDIAQIGITALCSNRDLPLFMPIGGAQSDLSLRLGGPVVSIRVLSGPHRPLPALPVDQSHWRLISLLLANLHSLVNESSADAAPLRELCRLMAARYDQRHINEVVERQIEGIQSLTAAPVLRPMGLGAKQAMCRGVQVVLTCNELAFEGAGLFLFGEIMARLLARYSSMNTFIELELHSQQRGKIYRWPASDGLRPII